MGEALVAVRLAFDASFTTTIDAVWEAGDAVLPIHPGLPDPEVDALLAEFRPGLLVEASGIRQLPGAEPVEPGTALVVPTSGTTGGPKGGVLAHDHLSATPPRPPPAPGRPGGGWGRGTGVCAAFPRATSRA